MATTPRTPDADEAGGLSAPSATSGSPPLTRDGIPVVPPDARLSLVAGLRTRIDAAGHVLVETPLGGIVDAGPQGLTILGLFSRPRTLAQALLALAGGPGPYPELMPVRATIVSLYAAGAIAEDASQGVSFGWTDPAEHARMLSDVRRTDAYIAALKAAVTPEDVVLDIGTGSGVLAVVAARSGARHVYAVEASDIAGVAQGVFEANGVADRVTLIEGWSTEIELPEPATILVTETLGVEPFEEDILRTIIDARHRLLAAGARTIPESLCLEAQALATPDAHRWASRIDGETVNGWRERYGIELGPLREARRPTPLHWPVDSQIVATWKALGPRAGLLRVDLGSVPSSEVRARTELEVAQGGRVDAVLVTFSARLYGDIHLDQRPRHGEFSSWDSSVWFLPDGIDVETGDRLDVEYRFASLGEADGLDCKLLT